VEIDLPSGGGAKSVSCKDAYEAIDSVLSKSADFHLLWEAYMKGLLGISDAAANREARVNEALAALNITTTNAQTYTLNAMLASILRDGPSALIERTGMEQLEMQWAGEQGLFMQVARPMMAFVETFTVAASPIVNFRRYGAISFSA
jgi:conjugal transfer mating pair stabilization protein TraG